MKVRANVWLVKYEKRMDYGAGNVVEEYEEYVVTACDSIGGIEDMLREEAGCQCVYVKVSEARFLGRALTDA